MYVEDTVDAPGGDPAHTHVHSQGELTCESYGDASLHARGMAAIERARHRLDDVLPPAVRKKKERSVAGQRVIMVVPIITSMDFEVLASLMAAAGSRKGTTCSHSSVRGHSTPASSSSSSSELLKSRKSLSILCGAPRGGSLSVAQWPHPPSKLRGRCARGVGPGPGSQTVGHRTRSPYN